MNNLLTIINLNKVLDAYKNSGFIAQQKARFIFYLCLIVIATSIVLLIKTTIIHYTTDQSSQFYWLIYLSLIGAISISFIIIGYVGYNIFSINKAALIKAELDIKERNEAEKALIKSEKKYKEMALLLPQVIFEADCFGKYTFLNKSGLDEFGYTNNDFSNGLTIFDTITEEDKKRIEANIGAVLRGEKTLNNQYNCLRKDGSTFPVQIYSGVILEEGIPVGFRGVIYNITEIVKVENDLKENSNLFKTLIESTPVSITMTDMEGNLIMANNAFYKEIGMTPEMIKGKSAEEVGITINIEKEKLMMEQILSNGYIENFETDVLIKGEKHYIYVYATVIEINNQKVILRTNINFTDKKKLINKLKESETLFRLMVDMVPYSIMIYNSKNHYTFANRAFLERFNLKTEEIIGKTSADIGIEMDEYSKRKFNKELEKKGIVLNLEVSLIGPDKKKRYVLLSIQDTTIDEKPHQIVSSVDITDQKLLEKQLIEYNQNLESIVAERTDELATTNEEFKATNEELYHQRTDLELALSKLKEAQEQLIETEKMASLGILTAGVAHEINNPINYIYNGTQALESYLRDNVPEHIMEIDPLLDAINIGIKRIIDIVKSLSKYSRKEDNSYVTCNIHEVIDNCLTMLYNQYKNHIEIIKEYDPEMHNIMINEGQMHQVFLNVINNAVQAIEDSGKITIRTVVKEKGIEVYIIDTGIGITTENIRYIFDPFFTTKDPGKGTGLGLSITQRIVHENNGTIQCKSKVGVGTEFFINLPFKTFDHG